MNKRIFIISTILLGLSLGLNAQAKVTSTLSSAKLLIGDQVQLTVSVKLENPSSIVQEISFESIDTVSNIEILNKSDLILRNKETGLWERTATLTSFEEGSYVLPSVRALINVNGSAKIIKSNNLGLKVETIKVNEKTELQPIKGIRTESINFRDILPYLLGLLALIGMIFLVRKWRNKERIEEEIIIPEIILPPHEIALTKLKILDQKQLWQNGDIKAFQSELTFIVRAYLEGRYDVPALESTTYEIIRDFKGKDISEEQKVDLKQILETADLVKFAKSEPPLEINQQAFDAIKGFILDTKREIKTVDEEGNND